MFKKCKFFLIVDSVESAIKFYAEKLLFTVVKVGLEAGTNKFFNYAELRRGKCGLIIRIPALAELGEFSMIRRINSRAAGMYLEVKDGLDKFFDSCKKKKLNITSELSRHPQGYSFFQLTDPFGTKIYVYQEDDAHKYSEVERTSFFGLKLKTEQIQDMVAGKTPPEMVDHMKGLGMSRRVSKKFIKGWFSEMHHHSDLVRHKK